MHLTAEEERILEGEEGWAASKAMEILVALGDAVGADRLIPVEWAHVSGVSYKNLGDEGASLLERFASDGRFRIRTTLNPIGMDLERWREMGVDRAFREGQLRILRALEAMGAELTLTCTPYYIRRPRLGEILAWAESSAVVYANSVLGARTNRESGLSALSAGLVGKTPRWGLLLEENRRATHLVRAPGRLDRLGYSALGALVGEAVGDGIPLIHGPRPGEGEMKAMGAAMAAWGAVSMFHVSGVTPEAGRAGDPVEVLELEHGDIEDFIESHMGEAEYVALGCPHLSASELREIRESLRAGRIKVRLVLFTSRTVRDSNRGLVEELEALGARVYVDTCMVVSPITGKLGPPGLRSGKALFYLEKKGYGPGRAFFFRL